MKLGIRDHVLCAIANDYEDFAIISDEVSKWQGKSVSHSEIVEALAEVISMGLAQAYVLSPTPPHTTPVGFSKDDVERLWFYVTPEGKRLVQSQVR